MGIPGQWQGTPLQPLGEDIAPWASRTGHSFPPLTHTPLRLRPPSVRSAAGGGRRGLQDEEGKGGGEIALLILFWAAGPLLCRRPWVEGACQCRSPLGLAEGL